jgi:hypothetical protein
MANHYPDYHVRTAADGQGYMIHIPGPEGRNRPCPVGRVYSLIPRPLRRVWWLGWAFRSVLIGLTRPIP